MPSGKASNGQPTRLSIQKNGRLLLTVSDWSITRVECADIDADRTFDLLVASHSGGAHCCETLHVWALDAKPRKLLEYPAGNAGGFELRDLDGDGRLELLVGDDTLRLFRRPLLRLFAEPPADGPLPDRARLRGLHAQVPGGAAGCPRAASPNGSSRPASRTTSSSSRARRWARWPSGRCSARRTRAWSRFAPRSDSDEVMKWLERARPQVRDWVAARGKRVKDGKR